MAERKKKTDVEVWKYTFGRDAFTEEDRQKILQIWKDNPESKVTSSGRLKKVFLEWAVGQGAKETEDGYCCLKQSSSNDTENCSGHPGAQEN